MFSLLFTKAQQAKVTWKISHAASFKVYTEKWKTVELFILNFIIWSIAKKSGGTFGHKLCKCTFSKEIYFRLQLQPLS